MTLNPSPAVLGHARGCRVWGGLLLAVTGWLLVPTTASASCGDYLAHPMNPLVAQRLSAGPQTQRETPVPTRPCNGPSCRRSDAPVPVPTPAPVRLLGERWANVLDVDVALPSAAAFYSPDAEELCTSALPSRLDRPPKAA